MTLLPAEVIRRKRDGARERIDGFRESAAFIEQEAQGGEERGRIGRAIEQLRCQAGAPTKSPTSG